MKKASKILLSSAVVVFIILTSCASTKTIDSANGDNRKGYHNAGNISGVDKFIVERIGRTEKGDAR